MEVRIIHFKTVLGLPVKNAIHESRAVSQTCNLANLECMIIWHLKIYFYLIRTSFHVNKCKCHVFFTWKASL